MKVLITGATGFVGSAIIGELESKNINTIAAVRSYSDSLPGTIKQVVVGKINHETQWREVLQDVDVVIHLAARVHVMEETAENPLDAFREVNLYGTSCLARQAAQAGVKRFIYISSIKVNGERTYTKFFTADDEPSPSDSYGISKAEAEKELTLISQETNLETVIIRPPLVYGPRVRGNFLRLLKLVNSRIPLPLASIANARSMVSLENICDLIINCIDNPSAAGKILLISDGVDMSTPELISKLANYLGVADRLFPFPPFLLRMAGMLTGKTAVIDRLCGSLVVDITDTRECLDWNPPQSPDEGIRQTVEWFLDNIKGNQN